MGDEPKLPKGKSRMLTAGEIQLARSVFGNSVDYSKVRIHNDKNNFLQGDNTTVTPDSNMYCANNYSDDFSKGSRHHFIHEMTHVWQYQNNVLDPTTSAAVEWVKSGFCYGDCYHYKADPKKDLLDYNLEQQADIVADWWALKDRRANPPAPEAPATPESLEQGMFAKMLLKQATELHAKNPNDPAVKAMVDKGSIAFDREGQAHYTQKYADQVNEDRRKEAVEDSQRDKDLEQVVKKFAANPSYAREPGFLESAVMLLAKGATLTVPYPMFPRR